MWQSPKSLAISKKLGNLQYTGTLEDGFAFKRHINQFSSTEVKIPIPDATRYERPACINEQHNNYELNIGDLVKIINNSTNTNA